MKKIVLSALVSVFLLSAIVGTSVAAQPRTLGVTVADWFRYGDFTVGWSSNNPNATFPPLGSSWLEEMNKTEWTLMSVQNISHTTIFFQTVRHFKDGTEKAENGSIAIDHGGGTMIYMAISANLGTNDTVYTSVPGSTIRINETVTRAYPSGVRETNHANMTQELNITRYIDSQAINGTVYEFVNFYWDRLTGILVEQLYEQIEQVGEYQTTTSMSYRITESNVWVVPEFPTWTSMLIILTILTVAIAFYKRRLLKTPNH